MFLLRTACRERQRAASPLYSWRNAISGSTMVARRAGTWQATSAIAPRNNVADASVAESAGRTL